MSADLQEKLAAIVFVLQLGIFIFVLWAYFG